MCGIGKDDPVLTKTVAVVVCQLVLIDQIRACKSPVEIVQSVTQLQNNPVVSFHCRAAFCFGWAEQQHLIGMDLWQAKT